MSEKVVTVTVAEGNNLFQISLGFALPEQLGDKKYSIAERALADRQVGKLFLLLRRESPIYTGPKRAAAFGPESAWEKFEGKSGLENYRIVDPDKTVELTLKKDIKSGAIWCLLLMLHPQSRVVLSAGQQAETVWPLAEKLGCVRMLRDEVGLPDEEASEKSPWDKRKADEDYKTEPVATEVKKDL